MAASKFLNYATGKTYVDSAIDASVGAGDAGKVIAADASGKLATSFFGDVTTPQIIGYSTGAGGTVTQTTSKATAVTLDKITGLITMDAAALLPATSVEFTVNNSLFAATDAPYVWVAAGTTSVYTATVVAAAAGSFKISVRNETAGSLSEAVQIGFIIFKAVTA